MTTEDEWQAICLLDQESGDGKRKPKRWGAFPKSPRPERVFFYPDIHFPFHNKLFLEYLDAQCDEFKPTCIVIIGDLLDCYSVSDFDKDPGRKETLNDEREAAVKWLSGRRQKHPDTQIIFIEGNHEERIKRQIRRYLPGLHDLPELTTRGLLKLDSLGVDFYPSYGFVRWGMRIKHGESTAKWSSNQEMLKHRKSGISGHVHREQIAEFTDGEGLTTTWRSLGHCCDLDYVNYGTGLNWKLGGGRLLQLPSGETEWEYLNG